MGGGPWPSTAVAGNLGGTVRWRTRRPIGTFLHVLSLPSILVCLSSANPRRWTFGSAMNPSRISVFSLHFFFAKGHVATLEPPWYIRGFFASVYLVSFFFLLRDILVRPARSDGPVACINRRTVLWSLFIAAAEAADHLEAITDMLFSFFFCLNSSSFSVLPFIVLEVCWTWSGLFFYGAGKQ